MQEIQIKLTDMQAIREFVKAVVMLPYDVDLVQGRYIVDAKSIMGIFSLDLMNPITMTVHNDNCDDIIEELKTLTVEEYYESMVDSVSKDLSFWHIFGRKIKHRDIYIKVRIKRRKKGPGFVFCISFHFARYIMTDFPYRK